ncbi:MAG: flavin reductase family protein [Desulfuromonas sp.]|nr:flavin reductase family protein [Desulfuromonas sp.]
MKKSLGAKPIIYPTPVFLVGSYDAEGKANIMNAAWGGLCSSEPPSVAVSVRKERYSFDCIQEQQAFTINIPRTDQVVAADYFGLVSGRDVDKIAASGMSVERAEHVNAPLLCECPLVLECRLTASIELGVHTQLIGEIVDVKIDEECLDEVGLPDIVKVDPLLFAPGNRAYFNVGANVGRAFAVGKELIDKKD